MKYRIVQTHPRKYWVEYKKFFLWRRYKRQILFHDFASYPNLEDALTGLHELQVEHEYAKFKPVIHFQEEK